MPARKAQAARSDRNLRMPGLFSQWESGIRQQCPTAPVLCQGQGLSYAQMAKHMKPIDLGAKRRHLDERFRENAELHRRMKAEALERWNERELVCIKPRCLSKRHAKGYCKIHYDRERRRERIQPR